MPEIDYERCDGARARELLDEIADLYVPVYSEPPYNSAPKFGRDRFLARTHNQTGLAGFTLITARVNAAVVGFSFGFTMAPGSWWANASAPPRPILDAAKFAVIELVVAPEYRGCGIGRTLLDELLAGRPEPYAALAAVIDAGAYLMYLRWGWGKVAEFRVEPPFSDALVLKLESVH